MTQPIIVPLDRTPFGEEALPIAVEIAGRLNVPIHLVLVHVAPAMVATTDQVFQDAPGADEDARYAEQAYLDNVLERTRMTSGATFTSVLLEGEIEETIARYVMAHNGQLIVMSTHGRGGVSRFFLGNIADGLIRELHVPVILVRPGHMVAPSRAAGPRKILIPLDGSEVAESTVDRVIGVFGRDGVELQLLQVVSMPLMLPLATTAPDQPALIERAIDSAQSYLDNVASQLAALGIAASTEVRIDELIASVIFSCVEEKRPDMVALATRGEGGIGRAVFGSVADKVVRASTVPVLVWNPPEESVSGMLKTHGHNK